MNGHRQAALLLHGLEDSDRRWLMGQMSDANQSALKDLLVEIKSLGIPQDGDLSRIAQSSSGTPPVSSSGSGNALRHASADQVLALLEKEPIWLVATILSLEPWPWRQEFLAQLEPIRRERIRIAVRDRIPPRLAAALILQLEKKLGKLAPESMIPRGHAYDRLARRFSRIGNGVRKWLR